MSLRNERRRRLLADDSLAGAADDESSPIRLAAGPAGETGPGAAAYAAAAKLARQRPVHDFVPSRLTMIGLVVAGALSTVGIVAALSIWSGTLAEVVSAEELLPLGLNSSHNLGNWLASTLLLIASLTSLLIYSLRRHRVDDYHGRYRLWIWAALTCLVASCAETASLADLARGLCRHLAGLSSLDDAVVWPVGTGVMLGAMGLRLLIEVRRSRLTVLALLSSIGSFLLAAAVALDWLPAVSEVWRPLVSRASCLVGYLFLLATLLLYARHVVLEIEGRVAVKPPKPKRKKVKRAAETTEMLAVAATPKAASKGGSDLEPVEKSQPATPVAGSQSKPAADKFVAPAAVAGRVDPDSQGALSRADRRKLRRESRMAS